MTRRERLIGAWGNPGKGSRYGRPDGFGALDRFGEILEAASGDLATSTVQVAALELHALGAALRRVAAGEDARHVFGQGKVGHRRSEKIEKWTVAYLYWHTLAELLEAGNVDEREAKQRAVQRAMRQFAGRKMKADTVVRYAGAYREAALGYMDDMHRIGNGPDPSTLRAYLKRHTRRGRLPD